MPAWETICADLNAYMVLKCAFAETTMCDPADMDFDTLIQFTMSIVAAQMKERSLPFRFCDQAGEYSVSYFLDYLLIISQ
jgi:hypothetical protein